jgi:hypothetical protein
LALRLRFNRWMAAVIFMVMSVQFEGEGPRDPSPLVVEF